MIVTQANAREIISALYPDMSFTLSKTAQIGIRPVYDPRPTLVWVKLDAGRNSTVKIGRILPNLATDWDFSLEQQP